MRVMGLSQWIQWIAYFIVNYIKILIVVLIASILMHFVTKQTSFILILIFFALYAFNATYYAFAISTFVNSGTLGTLLAIVGWILLYFWSSFFLGIDIQKPYPSSIRILNCINPNVSLNLKNFQKK